MWCICDVYGVYIPNDGVCDMYDLYGCICDVDDLYGFIGVVCERHMRHMCHVYVIYKCDIIPRMAFDGWRGNGLRRAVARIVPDRGIWSLGSMTFGAHSAGVGALRNFWPIRRAFFGAVRSLKHYSCVGGYGIRFFCSSHEVAHREVGG